MKDGSRFSSGPYTVHTASMPSVINFVSKQMVVYVVINSRFWTDTSYQRHHKYTAIALHVKKMEHFVLL
jgi:hypothetical protein